MLEKFGYGNLTASSSSVESYFNDLKNVQIRNLPLRIDEFIVKHCKILEDTMKLASGLEYFQGMNDDMETLTANKTIGTSSDKVEEMQLSSHIIIETDDNRMLEMNTVDNWMGLVDIKKSEVPRGKKKSLYLNPEPEWAITEIIEPQDLSKPTKIGILYNGGQINSISTRGKKGIISLSNTCAFDSIVQGIATCYCDSRKLRESWNGQEINDIFKLAINLGQNNVNANIYNERAQLLQCAFPNSSLSDNIQRINCETTIINILKQFNIISYKETVTCPNQCFYTEKQFNEIVACPNTLRNEINNLNQAILPTSVTTKMCSKCNFENLNVKTYNDIIFIDVAQVGTTSGIEQPLQVLLKQIPNILLVDKKTYYLRSLVEYIEPALVGTMGHFVAICRRSDWSWEKYDDLCKKIIHISQDALVNTFLLIYSV